VLHKGVLMHNPIEVTSSDVASRLQQIAGLLNPLHGCQPDISMKLIYSLYQTRRKNNHFSSLSFFKYKLWFRIVVSNLWVMRMPHMGHKEQVNY
jgi:hypothetical protein